MKSLKNFLAPYLVLTFSIAGCIGGLQMQPSPTDAVTATSGMVLSLSTPKATYGAKESIKLNLSIQNGQFDLLVPFVDFATSSVFKQLSVKDTNGDTVKSRPTIGMLRRVSFTYTNGDTVKSRRFINTPIYEEIFIEKNGKPVQCIQGFDLKAESIYEVSLENFQESYGFQTGSYTVTLILTVPVYRDFLKKQHPEIRELQEEIKRIQKVTDAHVSPADKRSAVNDLQQQIEVLEKRHKNIYLPVKSLIGQASLTSNSITLTIE